MASSFDATFVAEVRMAFLKLDKVFCLIILLYRHMQIIFDIVSCALNLAKRYNRTDFIPSHRTFSSSNVGFLDALCAYHTDVYLYYSRREEIPWRSR